MALTELQRRICRLFPLVRHEELGLTLHPFDLATNKVLALIGRLEVRDWVDVISCEERLEPLGYLVWAACGKDPGFSPAAILEQAARSSRYSADEVRVLDFAGKPPDPASLSRDWHAMLERAHEVVSSLPPAEAGRCVLTASGSLFRGGVLELRTTIAVSAVRFHAGCIRGALPEIVG